MKQEVGCVVVEMTTEKEQQANRDNKVSYT